MAADGVVLVTGGAGYIGSHTCVELLDADCEVVVVDNFCHSKEEAIRRIARIAKRPLRAVYKIDLRDREKLDEVFRQHDIRSVIHFAGLKAVGESVTMPIEYYHNNITGTLVLLDAMRAHGVKRIVFSSSATVYGLKAKPPCRETDDLQCTNPYGRTKLFIEEILRDVCVADPTMSVVLLRYFNPVGAHASGLIGEDPTGIPNNLVPVIQRVAVGKIPRLTVFGDGYPTRDGTGVRDYVHVVDLARGHLAALKFAAEHAGTGVFNLGTGVGFSVLEVVAAFERASGQKIPYVIGPARAGDVAEIFADVTKAREELHWVAELGLDKMMEDSWGFARRNPCGLVAEEEGGLLA